MGLKNTAVFSSIFMAIFIAALALNSCSNENVRKEAPIPDQVSYNFHIRPILSDNCFACHGPDANKREAGLRLDTEAGAYAALKENPGQHAIVPGNSNKSQVVKRIFSEDVSEKMPPPASNLTITDRERKMIKKWVDQGGVYEKHWAFEPPIKKTIPKTDKDEWNHNPIDGFVFAKMEEHGLSPSQKADKGFLLKRLSLDLNGLPPSSEEVRLFGSGEKSWEEMIDLYLNKPAYGEKLALLWLDISRYADSFGYQNDNIRTQWPYRDWVIHAFNNNFPYDKFLTWQFAGDLLPDPNREQLLATAFNRNHKVTEEEGVIHEEYRMEYVLDKTNTFSKVILGMTMECAQCHDHKYDPISQKDYYNLYAFFNNTPEKGFEGGAGSAVRAKTPLMWIDTEDTEGILDFVNHSDTSRVAVSIMQDLQDSIRPTFILDRA